MGVYIEKMKRPEGCYCCPFAEGSWGYSPPNRKWCLVNGKDMPIDERNVQQNQHQCPLIEIPPHGRLIDAEAFDERVRMAGGMADEELSDDFKDGIQATLLLLKSQRTIISAEPEEE